MSKKIVVTGANSGIGKAMAKAFATQGHEVVLVVRNEARGRDARVEIADATGSRDGLDVMLCDLSDLRSIAEFGAQYRERHGRLDVLVNNAGLYLDRRVESAQGHEMMFAVNHLGAFAVTRALWRLLPGGRVVTTSSGAHRMGRLDLGDLDAPGRFHGLRRYGDTKLMNILFTRELARRGAAEGIVANCFHPGAVATGFAQDERTLLGALVHTFQCALRTPDKGAATGVLLATGDIGGTTGEYWFDGKVRSTSPASQNPESAARLWDESERRVAEAARVARSAA